MVQKKKIGGNRGNNVKGMTGAKKKSKRPVSTREPTDEQLKTYRKKMGIL